MAKNKIKPVDEKFLSSISESTEKELVKDELLVESEQILDITDEAITEVKPLYRVSKEGGLTFYDKQ